MRNHCISLEPFVPTRDAELLRRWLEAPHVSRWWGTPDRAFEDALRPVEGGGAVLIAVDSTPVGFLRWQRVPRAALEAAGLHEIPDGTIDIDIAIGEPEWMGRGVGSQALRVLVAHLSEATSAPLIMICTAMDHVSALRAYEKAGFRRIRAFDDPDFGKMWLLTIVPSARQRQQ